MSNNEVRMWFVEIEMDAIWVPIGAGWPRYEDADWQLSEWRQKNRCYGDNSFRIREHRIGAEMPVDLAPWDDDAMTLTELPPKVPADYQ